MSTNENTRPDFARRQRERVAAQPVLTPEERANIERAIEAIEARGGTAPASMRLALGYSQSAEQARADLDKETD